MKPKYYFLTLIILLIGMIFIIGCNKQTTQTSTPPQASQSQQSGPVKCNDPPCLAPRFFSCIPAELVMSSGNQSVKISVLGLENERCHFTMVFGNVTAADCYFKKEDLTEKVLNQMFGNQEGQDAIIAEACKQ